MSIEWAQNLLEGLIHIPFWQVSVLYALFGLIQIAFPPFPGDILLFFGGSIWPGDFLDDLLPVLASYWAGTTVGSLCAYELGARFGVHIFNWRWMRRLFPERAQHAVARWLNTSGAITLFGAKFITGMNVPMLILSGAMGYERRKCYPVIILTTVVHNTGFYGLGTLLGDRWSEVAEMLGRYRFGFAVAIAVVILVAIFLPRLLARVVGATGKKTGE